MLPILQFCRDQSIFYEDKSKNSWYNIVGCAFTYLKYSNAYKICIVNLLQIKIFIFCIAISVTIFAIYLFLHIHKEQAVKNKELLQLQLSLKKSYNKSQNLEDSVSLLENTHKNLFQNILTLCVEILNMQPDLFKEGK